MSEKESRVIFINSGINHKLDLIQGKIIKKQVQKEEKSNSKEIIFIIK